MGDLRARASTSSILPREGEVAPKVTEGEGGARFDIARFLENSSPPVAFSATLP